MARYDDSKIQFDPIEKTSFRPIRLNVDIPLEYIFETVIEAGDSIEAIAERIYGQSKLWWVIADLNGLIHPLYIEPGTRLKILLPGYVSFYSGGE